MRARRSAGAVVGLAFGVMVAFGTAACTGSAAVEPATGATAAPPAVMATVDAFRPATPAAATPAAATPAAASAMPAPSATPMVDGYVTGSWEFYGPSSAAPSAGHQFVNLLALSTSDPRVNGDATYDAGAVQSGTTGYTWGVMTVKNQGGTWSGPCKGGSWGDAGTVIVSCELAGTGDYAGQGFYLQMRGSEHFPLTVEGVIYTGDIPEG